MNRHAGHSVHFLNSRLVEHSSNDNFALACTYYEIDTLFLTRQGHLNKLIIPELSKARADVVEAIFGAVFADSGCNFLLVYDLYMRLLFKRPWRKRTVIPSYMNDIKVVSAWEPETVFASQQEGEEALEKLIELAVRRDEYMRATFLPQKFRTSRLVQKEFPNFTFALVWNKQYVVTMDKYYAATEPHERPYVATILHTAAVFLVDFLQKEGIT